MARAAELPKVEELTDEQRHVVELDVGARTFVNAPAGTGKTAVLARRAAHLVSVGGAKPGEILILTFTRAAVQVIRDRLAEEGGSLSYIAARTFDSFATALLASVEPEGQWKDSGYDGRIREAASALARDGAARDIVGSFRHVLVDEVQDLVEPRDDLLRAVITSSDSGFTLFGDFAQSIYGFQLTGEKRAEGAQAFLRWLEVDCPGSLNHVTLSKNFRARSELTREVLRYGPRLVDRDANFETIRSDLEDLIAGLETLGDVKSVAPELAGGLGGRTAILCRTNAEALLVSRELWVSGVDHVLQRGAAERPVAPWVAAATRTLKRPHITEPQFRERYLAFGDSNGAPTVEDAWKLFRSVSRSEEMVDLVAMGRRIQMGAVPAELTTPEEHPLTVSTIHRSKGLEFDVVLVFDPETRADLDGIAFAEETRVLYVALTRPRDHLFHLDLPKTWGYVKPNELDDRWVRCARGAAWKTLEYEIKGDDLETERPAGMEGSGSRVGRSGEPAEIQEYLSTEVKRGDLVDLELIEDSDPDCPRYMALHDDHPIGATAERFGRVLRRRVYRPPRRLVRARIDGVDTVAGFSATAEAAGLGASPLWLRPRLVGLAWVEW